MIEQVRLRFDAAIKKNCKDKTDVMNFLLRHERKEVCIRNLCDQIIKCEGLVINFNVQKYNFTIDEVAKMFMMRALEHVAQNQLSASERSRRIAEADRLKNAEEHIAELEKETLREHKDEDWAREAIAVRQADEVQKRILRDAGGTHD